MGDSIERVARALCAREAGIYGYNSDAAADLWRRNRSRHLKEARAAIEAMPSGWRDIETAPKDGALIFGWSQRAQGCEFVGEADRRVRTGRMFVGRIYLDGPGEGPTSVRVSHWQPLPEPPLTSKGPEA